MDVLDNATYSTSTDDIAVQSCFFDIQLANLLPRNCIPPEVLLRVSRHPAWSASEKAVRSKPKSFGYQSPMLMDLTRIKFLTDGVLLREMMDDPLLSKYMCCDLCFSYFGISINNKCVLDIKMMFFSVIMVDEAHERSLTIDILLGLLKKIQRRRPELRLIIASATIEAKSMAEFFHTRKRRPQLEGEDHGPQTEPAILSIEGRGFNV
ncbi:probable pre-mRNA-splicing factor ATP-dependent RNA helicase DEAH9 isoform X2 [Tanacetum coccineum]